MSSRFFRLRWSDTAGFAVTVAIIAAAIIVICERRDTRVLAANIGITSYANGTAVVQVPYRRDCGPGTVTILVDGQTIAHAMPAYAMKYGNDNYAFRPGVALTDSALVRVTFDAGNISQTVRTRVKVVRARVEAAHADDVAPMVAADAAVAIAKSHSADESLPADPLTIVDELKQEMRWSASADVTPEWYVNGFNRWAMEKGLPIRTERVAGAAMLGAFARTLELGGTAQTFIQYKRAGRDVGGHLVAVVRIVRVGDEDYISIRDSMGPLGTDVYPVRNGALVGYGFSDEVAVLGWGFVQNWTK